MKDYLFEPMVMALPISGSSLLFPVRRLWCVGRNYADHAREMGADPQREAPFFFAKPADALVPGGGPVPYPPGTADLQHEVELVAAIGRSGAAIARDRAGDHVFGYAVGIDLTRRDVQAAARRKGQPWEMGKAFDRSAPISPLAPATAVGHPRRGMLRLAVNGVERQRGDLADMILPVPDLIAELSRWVAMAPGDLIFTGTPAGVGPLAVGDRVSAAIEGVGELQIVIVAPGGGDRGMGNEE
jgi:fumarylpyruvate hydrolase